MIKILLKIIPYKLFRRFGYPKLLPMNLTVGLTYRCNSRCKTCHIWQKKDKGQELTLGEWDKIFKNLSKSIVFLTFTGGEPFLKKEIVKICQSAYHHCRPRIITIPTNGLLTKTVVEKVSQIAKNSPQTQVIVNLSVDGLGDQDDQIRGVKGHYQKVMATYRQLKRLRNQNLIVGFHTVISKFNVKEFPQIVNTLLAFKPDSYVTEMAEQRVELGTQRSEISPSLEEYQKAVDYLIALTKKSQFKGVAKITQAFRQEYYRLTKKILEQKKQIIPCYAGWASAQIAPNGDVWGCCLKASVYGNLRKVNYQFSKIWFSPKADELRKSTAQGQCYCPMANASYTNMLMDFKTLLKVGLNFFG